jgi:ubiquinone/menaquinone biosynthesis C-methylase UbiE
MLPKGVFLCPRCRKDIDDLVCPHCGFQVVEADGIPLLVKDRSVIDAAIGAAKSVGHAAWYEDLQAKQWRGPFRHHLRKRRDYVDGILSAFKNAAPGPLTGLDLGCGDGDHLEWLHGYVAELYASDYNLLRLPRARNLNQTSCVFMADITSYPVRDNFFDLIYFNHVIEHIPDDTSALAEAYRILKPGGLLVLGTPNEGVWFWQLAYRLQPRMLRASDHVQFYTAGTLAAKCRAAGFKVQEIKHIGYGVPHWTLDAGLRQFKVVDDLFEAIGRAVYPQQATSLYLSLSK